MSRVDRYKHIHENRDQQSIKRPLIPENQWVNIEKKNQKN